MNKSFFFSRKKLQFFTFICEIAIYVVHFFSHSLRLLAAYGAIEQKKMLGEREGEKAIIWCGALFLWKNYEHVQWT